ncbi:heat shock protein GrpE [bacterium BMS3Bbin14]|nr:heat shock protein GrpE [bacterium BMS3Abin13]GBE53662.1 heat shock protein GrpE [bacterium BMS3Bbin14]
MTEQKEQKFAIPVEEELKSSPEVAQNVDDSEGAGSKEGQLEQDMETLRREAEENRDRLLRLAADFENYKKRQERERLMLLKYAGENILRELLPTLDNLDRAMEHAAADTEDPQKQLEGLLEGVDLTRKGLLAMLEKFDVSPLDSVGRAFDPNEHEALTMEPSNEVPANHVLREFAKGYRFKDRLLRPAKVVVSGGPE